MPDRWQLEPATRAERRRLVGEWLVWRYRRAAVDRGTQPVARQLRKQGVPLELALRILGIRPSRGPFRITHPGDRVALSGGVERR